MALIGRLTDELLAMAKGAATWAVIGGIVGAVAGVLTGVNPLVLAAGLGGSFAAMGAALAESRSSRACDDPAESERLEDERVDVFCAHLEAERESGPDRFRAMVSRQERSSHRRLH